MNRINRFFEVFLNGLAVFGFDPRVTLKSIKGLPFYLHDYIALRKSARCCKKEEVFPFGRIWPCLSERSSSAGHSKSAYFYQDLYVAQRVFVNNPRRHIDVGSRIDGFVAHVASYRKISILDIRPLNNDPLSNIDFMQCDLMGKIPEDLIESTDSLSCLHALEHFGLGRYGDPVDFEGYLLGLDNLHRILQPGGKLYLSVPIGEQRIEFNGQRVFAVRYMLELLEKGYELQFFSFVDDKCIFHKNVVLDPVRIAENFGCSRGLGIFELTKR